MAQGFTSTSSSGGVDTTAIHKATAAEISALTEKATPIAADLFIIEDSADSNSKKKVQHGSIDHNALTNFAAGEHRIINDGGTSSTELYSASKISTEIDAKVTGAASGTDNALTRFNGTNGKIIQDSGVILNDADSLSGIVNITLSGTVDGRDVATDGSKLDGIEAAADVTDATNVAAAGAVMKQKYKKIIHIENGDGLSATDTWPVFSVPFACTITRITHITDTGTVDWNLEERAEATPFTAGTDVYASDEQSSSTNSVDTSFANASLAAHAGLEYVASAVSGTPTKLRIQISFEEA
jgi:hypothetical protein